MSARDSGTTDHELTDAISATMVELYATHYGHERTTATTYINDNGGSRGNGP